MFAEQLTRKQFFVLAIVGLSLGIGCNTDSKTEEQDQVKKGTELTSHQKMVARLKAISGKSIVSNPYLGIDKLLEFENQLNELSDLSPAFERSWIQNRLGIEQLKAGKNREAVDNFSSGLQSLNGFTPAMAGVDPRAFYFLMSQLRFHAALAWFRIAESENCLNCTNGEGCLFPISKKGVHKNREGATNAKQRLLNVLKYEPENLDARWLLNLAAMILGEYPSGVPTEYLIPQSALEISHKFKPFKNVATELGIDTVDLSGGSIVDDFDGDGWVDLVTSTSDPTGKMTYFHNKQDGTFEDRSTESGLDQILGGINLIQADYDNDGDLDIFVCRGAWWEENGMHPNSLLQNDGSGKFKDVTIETGLADPATPTFVAGWSDFDNDGDLDLFISNDAERPCQLMENRDGNFVDIARSAGVTNNATVRGLSWGDYDGDGDQDLYVSNLGTRNKLYRNNGDKTFTDVAREFGVQGPKDSFACWFWDSNNDGALDLFVSTYSGRVKEVISEKLGYDVKCETPALYLGQKQGGFVNAAEQQGLNRVVVSMGANFGDADGDGFEDIYLGTGYPQYEGMIPNLFFRNSKGKKFEDLTYAARLGHLQKGHGISFADYDHDGDQDIFIQLGGAYKADAFHNALFQNPGFENNWISVRLQGVNSNRSAIGARIDLECIVDGAPKRTVRYVNSGGSFGANPLRAQIGLGKANRISKLKIYWPSTNTTQEFVDIDCNQFLLIKETDTAPTPILPVSSTLKP